MGSNDRLEGSFAPAPYGRACSACARAKCKCFHQPEGSICERCHRLGKICEPVISTRKRKATASPQHQQSPPPAPSAPPTPSRLENKLDDLVSLLRTQVERQGQVTQLTPQSTVVGRTPSSLVAAGADSSNDLQPPEVLLDTENSTVHFIRPSSLPSTSSAILEDVCVHRIPDFVAEEQLATFRRAFLPMFPFVHLPSAMTASDFRREKPFLWLNTMALTTKMVSQQFAMEETIWQIISQRIIVQHFADLDLLLGVVCFAEWSHHFKKDKPFMTTLAQLAVSLACELGLQGNVPVKINRCGASPRCDKQPKRRTLEERRTMLAVFHLTSATWTAYRKTEPMRWSQYLDTCVHIVATEGAKLETQLDTVLVVQVKCQLITNDLLFSSPEDTLSMESNTERPSTMVIAVMLRQLSQIRQNLPLGIGAFGTVQLYLYNAELLIRKCSLRRATTNIVGADAQRIRNLDSVLTCIEGWLDAYGKMPLNDMVGIHVDNVTQFLHCIVVLFKLTTLNEPGWDLDEVRRRADVFKILDDTYQQIDSLTSIMGIVDAEGSRSGLFFKAKPLWRAIKALLLAEMPADMASSPQRNNDSEVLLMTPGEDIPMDDFLHNIADEPWLLDIFTHDWTLPEGAFDMAPFPT